MYDKIIKIINEKEESSIIGLSIGKKKSKKKRLLLENIKKDFNKFFDSLDSDKKRKIINLLIDKDEFYEFFELENFYDKKHKIPPKIERVLKIKKLLYHNGEISEDITNSFLKYAFEEQ